MSNTEIRTHVYGLQRQIFICQKLTNLMFFYRNWSVVQTFGLLNACCLCVSTRGLSLLCRKDFIKRGDTRQKSIISESNHPLNCTCAVINFQTKQDWPFCCLYMIYLITVLSGSVSTLVRFTPGGDDQRSTRSWCFLSGWYVSCEWKHKLLHTVIKSTAVYQLLTDNSLLSGNSTRGAVPLRASLGSLEAADRAADPWGGETGGFRPSVPAQTSPQDGDTVEGQQHWDTRQVTQAKCCSRFWVEWRSCWSVS